MSPILPPTTPPPSLLQADGPPLPVRRVICIGRNYAEHDREMGGDGRTPPFHFLKSASALASGAELVLPYPPQTQSLHHEVEAVLYLGDGGRDLDEAAGWQAIAGVGVGLDMTRRDVQAVAKTKGRPWAAAKDFDSSGLVGLLVPAGEVDLRRAPISLTVDGAPVQQGHLGQMIWSAGEIVAELSRWMTLSAGDVIFSGTPAGVGALEPGARLEAHLAGCPPLSVLVGPRRGMTGRADGVHRRAEPSRCRGCPRPPGVPMFTTLLLSLLTPLAAAEDCSARDLERSLRTAPPISKSAIFVDLASCDPARARRVGPGVIPGLIPDTDTEKALVAGAELGLGDTVRTWLSDQEPDARARALGALGRACADSPELGTFFVESAQEVGDTFWAEGWHKPLGACRTPEVQALLTEALSDPEVGREAHNSGRFFGLLGVYARNLGTEAVPTIAGYLKTPANARDAALLINAMGAAANLGGQGGLDAEATEAVRTALVEAAPTLPPESLETARNVLGALGADDDAGALARWRWAPAFEANSYRYGVALIEDVTCKNGKQRGLLHLGTVEEPGEAWPDQVAPRIQAFLPDAWAPALDGKCKGEGEATVLISETPLSPADLVTWHQGAQTQFEGDFAGAQKTWIETHPPVALPE